MITTLDALKCRWCDYTRPQYFRLVNGQQRSGWRLLESHAAKEHRQYTGTQVKVARVDDQCPACDGKGCEYCEPNGPCVYDGNTGEPAA